MYKVQVMCSGKELPTEKLWETLEKAEGMLKLYKVFYASKGAENFTFNIVEIPDANPK